MARSKQCRFGHNNCAGCRDGKCRILIDQDFKRNECPFFKTREQNERELMECRKRLARLGLTPAPADNNEDDFDGS